jgi:hypothetical protein
MSSTALVAVPSVAPKDDPRPLYPSRFVTIELFSALTGYTENAVRLKISRGIWLENRQWVKRDGRVMMDIRGYEQWAETGRA